MFPVVGSVYCIQGTPLSRSLRCKYDYIKNKPGKFVLGTKMLSKITDHFDESDI